MPGNGVGIRCSNPLCHAHEHCLGLYHEAFPSPIGRVQVSPHVFHDPRSSCAFRSCLLVPWVSGKGNGKARWQYGAALSSTDTCRAPMRWQLPLSVFYAESAPAAGKSAGRASDEALHKAVPVGCLRPPSVTIPVPMGLFLPLLQRLETIARQQHPRRGLRALRARRLGPAYPRTPSFPAAVSSLPAAGARH
jgi:hypothetical protein